VKDQYIETISMVRNDHFSMYMQEERHLVLSMEFLRESYLGMLIGIFDDGYCWTNVVKKHLKNPDSEGITGEMIDIIIDRDRVIIQPQEDMVENPEELAIEIDRQQLIDIINKWDELTTQNYRRITFTRHEDGSITLSGSNSACL